MMATSTLKILFLGAGKRLSLLEAFVNAARQENVSVELHCAELRSRAPVATIASVMASPAFSAPEFPDWLRTCITDHAFDIVVPNMDSATVALARMEGELSGLGAWCVVSTAALCESMEDKQTAESWFIENGFDVPGKFGWPRIFKRRFGFASRGQVLVRDDAARARFISESKNISDYLEQDWIAGKEYSVDAYVDRRGNFVAAMPRVRFEVAEGEVNTSLSAHHREIEALSARLFSLPGWQGPLTAQFIDTAKGPILLEVNPRFGGGVTHAIHCGLDMPRWLIREALDRPLPSDANHWRAGSLMMRCRRDVFFDNDDAEALTREFRQEPT